MSASMQRLRELEAQGSLRPIDGQLADLARRMMRTDRWDVLLAVALASRAVGRGDVCLDLAAMAGKPFPDRADDTEAELPDTVKRLTLPAERTWLAALSSKAAACCIGGPDDHRPLVLEGSRLYLRRFWQYEQQVLAGLRARAGLAGQPPAPWFEARLRQYFPDEAGPGAAIQRDAARTACSRRFALLSGGPGTGKTYTVARIVALLAEDRIGGRPLKVHLAAPTGKAAARVQESIRKAKADFSGQAAVLGQIPEVASTLHRLLGASPGSPYFRHDRSNPLDTDVVVVDEASMIDLPMMAKLLAALPDEARLILVGDQDQLASVEPGKVFGDLCEAAAAHPVLKPCLSRLTHSRRFTPDSPIGRLSAAINRTRPDASDDLAQAWQTLVAVNGSEGFAWHDAAAGLRDGEGHPRHAFRLAVLEGYRRFLDAVTPADAFAALNAFRVLGAVRGGPAGVPALNRLIEAILALKDVTAMAGGLRPANPLKPRGGGYDHQPILVTANDYALGLYNGDVGIVLAGPDGTLSAWFEQAGPDGTVTHRRLALNLLPPHETAFAMTVHKAQGSEFDRVLLVLPSQATSPVLTRELLYTGLTRTRGPLALWCTDAVFAAALARRTQRTSGLKARLDGSFSCPESPFGL